MYMMAFVTLMVVLMGAFTQVYVKIAAQGISRQTGVVDTMMSWHNTALNLGMKYATAPSPACSLTKVSGGGTLSLALCDKAGEVFVGMPVPAGMGCDVKAVPCISELPDGYDYNNTSYKFYSVAFSQLEYGTTRYYILTYIPPPPTGGDTYKVGLVCLPGAATALATCSGSHKQLPVAFNTVYKEFRKNKKIPQTAFGVVKKDGATLYLETQSFEYNKAGVTNPVTGSFKYTIPILDGVPPGSIGIITEYTPA